MPDKNVQVVRAMVDAVNRRDWDACIKDAAPGFVWDNSRAIGTDNRVVLTSAEDARDFFKKLVAGRTDVDYLTVRGRPGYWVRGAHYFLYVDDLGRVQEESVRLAANVLLWDLAYLGLGLAFLLAGAVVLKWRRSRPFRLAGNLRRRSVGG